MIDYKKLYGRMRVIFAIAALLFIIILLANIKGCDKPDPAKPSRKVEKVKETPPTTYTDKGGTTHTEKVVARADIAAIKASYERMIDSLKQVLRIKDRQIEDIIAAGTSTTGTFKPRIDTLYIDSVPSIAVSYNDKWLDLFGVVNQDSSWSYTYTDSLVFTTYWKKTGFLKLGRTLVLDAFSHNPNTAIRGLTGIKINKAKPKKWGIGLNASYGFDGRQWKPMVGVGVNYNLIRF